MVGKGTVCRDIGHREIAALEPGFIHEHRINAEARVERDFGRVWRIPDG
jgi:hypothetical protein